MTAPSASLGNPDPASRRTTARGVTLLHLMIALALIGVLSAAALWSLAGQRQRAHHRAAQSDIAALARALDAYRLDTGAWPGERDGLEALVYDNGKRGWNGPYLKSRELPVDPWGRPYRYARPPQRGLDFDLFSMGEDGIAGTGDDIGNWSEKN